MEIYPQEKPILVQDADVLRQLMLLVLAIHRIRPGAKLLKVLPVLQAADLHFGQPTEGR